MNKGAMRYRIKTFRQYFSLICELVKRDIKLKYRRSFLGYLWSILNPLLIMLVLTVVFSAMFKKSIENYPIYLLTGRVLFDFMRTATTAGLKSVTNNASLLKKTYIPKYVFTVAKVTSTMVDTVFSLGAFFIVMLATRTAFHWQLVLLPLVLLQVYIFSMGLAFLLAELEVFFRDIEYLWNVSLLMIMYISAIFYYPEKILASNVSWILKYNPLFCVISNFRSCIFGEPMNLYLYS